jgi:flagellar hook-associated protein 1 FlgK
MSLIGALNIGKSAMAVSQAAIQTTGNNIANAGNADYTRQVARITPNKEQQLRPGIFIGNGINLSAIERQIDEALQTRLRGSFGDEASADAMMQWMGRIESVFNELSDEDLSTQFSTFFASWSNLANKPQDVGLRQIVLQSGASLANWFNNLRSQLVSLTNDADARLQALTSQANDLASQLAGLNAEIVRAEGGQSGQANALRDQRDALLGRLATLMDVKTIQRSNGSLDVFIGSEPLVIGSDSRGLELKLESVDGELHSKVVFSADKGAVRMNSGSLGALDQVRKTIDAVVEQVDKLAGELIFELNKLHSSGQGLTGMRSATSTNIVEDPTVALNAAASGLKFTPTNGSFVVHVKDKQTGLINSTLVQIDLNGTGSDTTLNSLVADLNAIDNLSASITGGRLDIAAGSRDVEISFSQDSSGVLSALGINGFFTGTSARDIAVSQRRCWPPP